MASLVREEDKVPFPAEDIRVSPIMVSTDSSNSRNSSAGNKDEIYSEQNRSFPLDSKKSSRIRTMTEGNVLCTPHQNIKCRRGRYYTVDMSAVARCESWRYEACGKVPPRCKTPTPRPSPPITMKNTSSKDFFIVSDEEKSQPVEDGVSKALAISLHHAALTPGSEPASKEVVIETSGFGGNKENISWDVGVCCHQGTRSKNEDDFIIVPDLNLLKKSNSSDLPAEGYFAVFDGHCGILAANYAKEKLHTYVIENENYDVDVELAFTQSCERIDHEFLELSKQNGHYDGTTAIFALIRDKKLVVGNIGDCAAVLCRSKRAHRLSDAHKPAREDEEQRILAANGWVTSDEDGISRVCGELSVSRAIGDIDYKGMCGKDVTDCFFAFPDGHSMEFKADLIISDPQFMTVELQDDDSFILIACDGLWDVMDEETAVEVTLELMAEENDAEEVAKKMCHLAEKMGSPDNITIMLIKLHHNKADQTPSQQCNLKH